MEHREKEEKGEAKNELSRRVNTQIRDKERGIVTRLRRNSQRFTKMIRSLSCKPRKKAVSKNRE